MASKYLTEEGELRVKVQPGICGLECTIVARNSDSQTAEIIVIESDCKKIQKMSSLLNKINIAQIMIPMDKNPVYLASADAGLHPSCPLPSAVIKACEVVLDLAVPQDVQICFEK